MAVSGSWLNHSLRPQYEYVQLEKYGFNKLNVLQVNLTLPNIT